MRLIRTLARRAALSLQRGWRALVSWWAAHRRRLTEDAEYAEALAATVLAAVPLISESYRVRWATGQLLHAYIALNRAFAPPASQWGYPAP